VAGSNKLLILFGSSNLVVDRIRGLGLGVQALGRFLREKRICFTNWILE
jgi:hypothetical protein